MVDMFGCNVKHSKTPVQHECMITLVANSRGVVTSNYKLLHLGGNIADSNLNLCF